MKTFTSFFARFEVKPQICYMVWNILCLLYTFKVTCAGEIKHSTPNVTIVLCQPWSMSNITHAIFLALNPIYTVLRTTVDVTGSCS